MKVNSRGELIAHVNKLVVEFQEHPENWENDNLGSFLEAFSAWLEDTGKSETVLNEAPSWQLIADAFLAAQIYE